MFTDDELFFVISGFVILPSVLRYTLQEFAGRRFFRLYPLFFAFSVLFALLNATTGQYPDLNNWETIVSAFLFLTQVEQSAAYKRGTAAVKLLNYRR